MESSEKGEFDFMRLLSTLSKILNILEKSADKVLLNI